MPAHDQDAASSLAHQQMAYNTAIAARIEWELEAGPLQNWAQTINRCSDVVSSLARITKRVILKGSKTFICLISLPPTADPGHSLQRERTERVP